METEVHGVKFSDKDVINGENFDPQGTYNPHGIHPFLFHNEGFVLGVVFASSLQDAFDELVDANKIDHFQISEEEMKDYPDRENGDPDDRITFLGNASEPFDIEGIDVIELRNPPFSFVAQFKAYQEDEKRKESINGTK